MDHVLGRGPHSGHLRSFRFLEADNARPKEGCIADPTCGAVCQTEQRPSHRSGTIPFKKLNCSEFIGVDSRRPRQRVHFPRRNPGRLTARRTDRRRLQQGFQGAAPAGAPELTLVHEPCGCLQKEKAWRVLQRGTAAQRNREQATDPAIDSGRCSQPVTLIKVEKLYLSMTQI